MEGKLNILLAEDDLDLGNMLLQFLELKNYRVNLCRDGQEAFELYREQPFDICILDVMMPRMDGFQLASELKTLNTDCAIIFLTAKQMQKDKLMGLSLGADDYITKPFDPEELELRIKNLSMRLGKHTASKLELGIFNLEMDKLQLNDGTNSIQLTEKEALLLQEFIGNKNSLLKKKDILLKFWGESDYFLGRSLDVFITRLRKLLKEDSSIQIKTVRGQGYILESH